MTEKRRRDKPATKAALLESARLRFARDGYDATSVRDVARDAGVDPTLIFRYFGSKKQLFDEATTTPAEEADLLDGPPEEMVARMVSSVVFHDWSRYGGEHPLVAMLRSSALPDVRERIRDEVCHEYVDAFEKLVDGPDAALRAELLSAWLVGMGILRSVVRTPAMSDAQATDLAPYVEAVATSLLGRPMTGVATTD
ncbi:TetR/AcrR family transcriptional regulator [Phytoactinopolyspora endophytica]|uniref:TetR/AcrR family transcriptional regulator n=1 Tax=Phytoactinopolyspora endophytica TaxID=1642495 RepID=UPI00101C9A84|nr:TetR/AcrR family transcriptional regulator [Phytoactinopolyspora endophytica]